LGPLESSKPSEVTYVELCCGGDAGDWGVCRDRGDSHGDDGTEVVLHGVVLQDGLQVVLHRGPVLRQVRVVQAGGLLHEVRAANE
jgi:hypothetical protein